ncbi:hypothetical protein [Chloroflexus sp.]|uniref:hypothetical protein n=1 Tax=Chloroflexus sp. TaxID=1904827 RepID=UPI002ACD6DAE|nr:hypothetical protein [Chloroflexus sp.]
MPQLFAEIWIPEAVQTELQIGLNKGYSVPSVADYSWLRVVNPTFTPSEWLVADVGSGEIAVMALALEHPDRIVQLDDALARRIAQGAGLRV